MQTLSVKVLRDPCGVLKDVRTLGLVVVAVLAMLSQLSCASGPAGPDYSPQERQALLQAVLPQRIEIVAPFTQPVTMGDDPIPDALEVVLQPFDSQGEPAKLVGNLVFELYAYREASADPKGTLVQTWLQHLNTAKSQEMYWDRQARMYRIPLLLDAREVAQGSNSTKFVLLSRYNDPWGKHLEDEAVIDLSSLVSQVRSEMRGQ